MGALVFFILLFIVSVTLLIISVHKYYEILGTLSSFGLVAGVVGSLFVAVNGDMTSEWIEGDVYITRTNRIVIVDDGKKTWEFDTYKDYNAINDSTRFYFRHTTNFFGTERVKDIKYENK